MAYLQNFTKRFFILLNIVVGFLFLLSCCNSFLHPDKWWFISLLAFFFPLFLILMLLFIFFWAFTYARLSLISILCLVVGWQNIHAFFGFSLHKNNFSHKDSSSVRVMTWNVRRWDEFITKKIGAAEHRLPMFELIAQKNADILCFQEFYEPADSSKSNIRYIQHQLGYPYYYFSKSYRNRFTKYETGVVIFSKFPILATAQQRISPDSVQQTESLISADVEFRGNRIRIFTTHLQSVLFKSKDFRNVEIIRNAEDSMLEASRSLVKKLKYALGLRGYQADIVRRQLDSCNYPLIICGDFNDVPNSYSYFHIRGKLQDAFIAKCFGIGRSYIQISPTLRIDYIFPSQDFTIVQSMKQVSPYSDHHAMLTDLRLQDRNR
jgi:endonuclease/exonuclease/phosphatase family metal-dependent hydrolase